MHMHVHISIFCVLCWKVLHINCNHATVSALSCHPVQHRIALQSLYEWPMTMHVFSLRLSPRWRSHLHLLLANFCRMIDAALQICCSRSNQRTWIQCAITKLRGQAALIAASHLSTIICCDHAFFKIILMIVVSEHWTLSLFHTCGWIAE